MLPHHAAAVADDYVKEKRNDKVAAINCAKYVTIIIIIFINVALLDLRPTAHPSCRHVIPSPQFSFFTAFGALHHIVL